MQSATIKDLIEHGKKYDGYDRCDNRCDDRCDRYNIEGLVDEDLVYGIKSPKKSCKHCNETGIEGRVDGRPILCRCLKRHSGEWITWREVKELNLLGAILCRDG